jgi:hypothetical protein
MAEKRGLDSRGFSGFSPSETPREIAIRATPIEIDVISGSKIVYFPCLTERAIDLSTFSTSPLFFGFDRFASRFDSLEEHRHLRTWFAHNFNSVESSTDSSGFTRGG